MKNSFIEAIKSAIGWSIVIGIAMVWLSMIFAPDNADAAKWWFIAAFVAVYMYRRGLL